MAENKKEHTKLAEATVRFAGAHRGQVRKRSGIPYYSHCLEVMKKVDRYREKTEVSHEQLLIATIGHDLIEDTIITYEDIVSEFDKETADVILECSRDPDDENQAGKYGFLMSFKEKSHASVVIKVADRLSNVEDYYADPETREYASTYALQAYPLLNHAYRTILERDGEVGLQKLYMDLRKLDWAIRLVYDFDIFKEDQEDAVREIVASNEPMKGHNTQC